MRRLPLFAALLALALPALAQVPTAEEEARWDRAFASTTFNAAGEGVGAAEFADGRVFLGGFDGGAPRVALWANRRWTEFVALRGRIVRTPIVMPDGRLYVFLGALNSTGGEIFEVLDGGALRPLGLGGGTNSTRLFAGPAGRLCAIGDLGGAAGRLACYDGAAWTTLGTAAGSNGFLYDAAVGPDGRIYVTGDFTSVNGVAARFVAAYDGSAWAAVGDAAPFGQTFRQGFRIALDGAGRVLISTQETVNNTTRSRLWAFPAGGAGPWAELPTTASFYGRTLVTANGGAVYAVIFDANGGQISTLARIEGSALVPVGVGSGGSVNTLAPGAGGGLLVVGTVPSFGNLNARGVVRYDGAQFRAYGDGLTGEGIPNFEHLVARAGGGVCVGGDVMTAGGLVQRRPLNSTLSPYGVACWTGARWDTLAAPIPNGTASGTGQNNIQLSALVSDAAGRFYAAVAVREGTTTGRGAFRYENGAWTRLGGLFASTTLRLALTADGTLYGFGAPAGATASRVQRWTGSAWADVGTMTSQGVGRLVVTGDGAVWASGSLTVDGATATLARFDGTSWATPPAPAGTTIALYGMNIIAGPGSSLITTGVQFYNAAFQVAFDARVARLDGTTWTKLGDPPFTTNGATALAHDGRGNVVAAATGPNGEGLTRNTAYRYAAATMTWTRLTTGFDTAAPTALLFNGGALYAAGEFTAVGTTPAYGFARWTDPTSVAVAPEPPPAADGIRLRLAPNPARGRSAVLLTLGRAQRVRAAVYDVTGREVARLFDGALPAGEARFDVPLSGLAAGVYLVRVDGETVRVARSLVVAR